jgi:hypothetical protein
MAWRRVSSFLSSALGSDADITYATANLNLRAGSALRGQFNPNFVVGLPGATIASLSRPPSQPTNRDDVHPSQGSTVNQRCNGSPSRLFSHRSGKKVLTWRNEGKVHRKPGG